MRRKLCNRLISELHKMQCTSGPLPGARVGAIQDSRPEHHGGSVPCGDVLRLFQFRENIVDCGDHHDVVTSRVVFRVAVAQILECFDDDFELGLVKSDLFHAGGTNTNCAGQRGGGVKSGAPRGIRTPDPQIRSLMLYPAELGARSKARIAQR